MLEVKSFVTTGPAEENCYFIYNDSHLIIVDPGNDPELIQQFVTESKRQPVAILLTHTHYDHIGALEAIRHAYEIPVYVSPAENDWLGNPRMNLSAMRQLICQPADQLFEMKEYTLGGMTFRVVPTPGHSIGGVSFVFDSDRFVITGDALFAGSIGRTDLPTGNHQQLLDSIQAELFTLPEDYVAYPGHRGPTTIGHEKETNPFFNN